ncbi:unnamed protein product [Ceratitis capitata]|uniref:(Mediterranean fruit fly) hypothetical protein n=1 Tax=Ceratitis capitata TaxID=7213 RepID=A0A811UTF3_CERCA|nr:unnamed protein product [Ceratitis capitata]
MRTYIHTGKCYTQQRCNNILATTTNARVNCVAFMVISFHLNFNIFNFLFFFLLFFFGPEGVPQNWIVNIKIVWQVCMYASMSGNVVNSRLWAKKDFLYTY